MSNFDAKVVKAIKEEVEKTLLARDYNATLRDETDFIMGAVAVMRIVNMKLYEATEEESMNCIPPMWLLWPMSGRSIVNELKLKTDDSEGRDE